MFNEIVSVRQLGRRDDFFMRRIRTGIFNIIFNRPGKQMRILQNNPQRPPQIILADQLDVDPVIGDRAFLHIIKPIDQVGHRRFPRTRRADKGQLLSRFGKQFDIVKHGFAFDITKADVMEPDVAGQLNIINAAVFVAMFPGPVSGRRFRFAHPAGFVLIHIDQRHAAVIDFMRFI